MQINCKECRGKAIIHSRKELDVKMSQLYCTCKNPECGHTLSPSGQQARNMILDLFRNLPAQERESILKQAAS